MKSEEFSITLIFLIIPIKPYNMKKTIISLALLLAASSNAQSQSIDSVLCSIERNNTALLALAKSNEADKMSLKAANNLRETTINYSPFYADGVSGVASSEFIVSQEFDFPTLYAARNKAAKIGSRSLDTEYAALRNDILFEAQLLCIDLIHQHRYGETLTRRSTLIQELGKLYEKRVDEGSATIIELDKIKLELMKVKADMEQFNATTKGIEAQLRALNGDKEVKLSDNNFPNFESLPDDATIIAEYLANDTRLQVAQAQTESSRQSVTVSKQNGLPKLSVGYRRNTELSSARNGFLVGAALPIFSNRNKVREAKMRHESMQLQMEDTRIQQENALRARLEELRLIKAAMEAYDIGLMQTAIANLTKAVEEGQITAIGFIRENDTITSRMLEYFELVRKYHRLAAEVMRYKL